MGSVISYDVFIPVAKKDEHKLRFCVESLKYLNPQPDNIFVVGEFYERTVLNLNKNAATNFRRPAWIYQQFLKLFQDETVNDQYLVVDSDLILLKQLDLFNEDGKPYFFLGIDQFHKPYFNYSEEVFGFGREYNHSFISEIMMMNKNLTLTMLKDAVSTNKYHTLEQNIENLYRYTCERAREDWIPADYELYGNYVEKYFKTYYDKKHFKTSLAGKHGSKDFNPWTEDEIKAEIERVSKLDYDALTVHTWL